MKWFKKVGLLALVLVGFLYARPATTPPSASKVYDYAIIDGSELCMFVTNYGSFGHNVVSGGSGGWWPRVRRNETYIYGAGPWIGAKVRNPNDPTKWDTVVTFFYNPNSGQSEGAPSFVPTWSVYNGIYSIKDSADYRDYSRAVGDAQARVYISSSDNAGYGWPIVEVDDEGNVIGPYILSTLDTYTRFTDLNPSRQESGSRVMGVLVDQWTYQFDVPGLKDITFLLWKVTNISGDTLRDVYIGACYDDDIGNESGSSANDLVGFVRKYNFPDGEAVLNLAYQYQLVPEAGWLGVDGRGLPGVIGSVFLRSPIASDTVVIHDMIGTPVGPDTVFPGQPLGMTAFKIFTLQIDPRNDVERYSIMVGWDPASAGGAYNPFMDDVYGPGDKRFLQASGPFTMAPGDTAWLVVAAVIAKDSTNIKFVAKKAIDVFNANFVAPQPPAKPNLYAWGKDREVVLWWDDAAETSRDRFYDIESGANPLYREYDFEGYILRRSMDGIKWDTLGRWDLIKSPFDGKSFTVIYTDSLRDFSGNIIYTDSIFLGTNTGIVHNYVDKDPNLRNGVRYIYELIPYDINYSSGTWFSLTGAPGRVIVVPHKNPIDEKDPSIQVNKVGIENSFKYDYASILTKDPDLLKPGKYTLRFFYEGPSNRKTDGASNMVSPLYTLKLLDSLGNEVLVLDKNLTLWTYDTLSTAAKYTGILPSDISYGGFVVAGAHFEVITDLSGSYFAVNPDLVGTPDTIWKFRNTDWTWNSDSTLRLIRAQSRGAYFAGSVYRITWKHVDTTGDQVTDVATLEVVDTLTGAVIPFDNLAFADSVAMGWAFVYGPGAGGSLRNKPTEYIPLNQSAGNTRYVRGIRLPGTPLLVFADGTSDKIPRDGTVWYISTYTTSSVSRIPYNTDYYEIEVKGPEELSDFSLTQVKVVPNPYYVLTPLDKTKEYRSGVRFINLPKNATIRIYNPAGDLVKVIQVTPENDGEVRWDLLTEYGIRPASGIYMYRISTPDGKEQTGKIAVIF